MAQNPKLGDFRERQVVATIKSVDPQKRTVDVEFITQRGDFPNLTLPYLNVSATWGRLYMPKKGDKVLLSYTQGNRPTITGFVPQNSDYLPYLESGEIADVNENGTYTHLRVRRRRDKRTNGLIDPDSMIGADGKTLQPSDIEDEPGGWVMRVRSKKNPNGVIPRWYNHSYIAAFENGDVTIQSMVNDIPRGMLYMDGSSGYVYLGAGLGRVQQYFEMNPALHEIFIMSDGEIHQHSIGHTKHTNYGDHIHHISGIYELKPGLDASTIPSDYSKISADSHLNPGDINIDNTLNPAVSGMFYCTIGKHLNFTSNLGNFEVMTPKGKVGLGDKSGNLKDGTDNGVRQDDLQTAINDVLSAVQKYIKAYCQPGSGATGTMDKVTATASSTVFLKD